MFQSEDIPILKGEEDSFIRRGYFGGGTDYYKAYAKDLHYYDVNSLYPFAMNKELPLKPIKKYSKMTDISLNDVFGFFQVEVETPKNIIKPLLPYKHKAQRAQNYIPYRYMDRNLF
uniref:hypothetical protein n=1 Tax=Infundibulicybe hongyinpan TaxID=2486348 RepID=UPI00315D3724